MHVLRPALAWTLPATALCLLLQGCGFKPTHDDLHFSLSDATLAALEEEDLSHVAPQIEGALELYFGTPQDPAFLQTEDWADDGFNPNLSQYPDDNDGGGEFSEEELDAIWASNEKAFKRELRLVEAGQHRRIKGFRTAPKLDEAWWELVESYVGTQAEDGEGDAVEEDGEGPELISEEEFKEEANYILTNFYPSLRDSAEMYRQQCLHCHGTSGGGDGPTAEFLNPLPRDYRKGIFKFTAVKDKARPRRADLFRILSEGVKGTAMPPFRRFSDAQIHGLVDYVRLLAIRGEVEEQLVLNAIDAEGKLIPSSIEETYVEVWEKWQAAEESFFFFDGEVPKATPELIARGAEIFGDATSGNCASCHGETGRGDGNAAFAYPAGADENAPALIGEDGRKVSAYQDDWGNPIYPRDLTQRNFRGGGRPIDIYRRIYAGINGTPMPAVGESKTAEGEFVIPDEDMWALVHFVKSLSDGADHRIGVMHADAHGAHDSAGHGDESHGEHDADQTDHEEGQ